MDEARVLLVEGNPIMCKFMRFALEAQGIRVSEAHAGRDALALWAEQPSDLVLQDVMLPDMDGFELVSRLRALPSGADVPILALSGLLSGSEEARISAVGFSDIITKPIDPAHLLQVVRAHLPRPEAKVDAFGQGRRVLIVDDDPVQAKLIGFRLKRLGFVTSFAADGVAALRLARIEAPAAIVSDVMMPLLDGFGLCVAIRQDPNLAATPLVLMTNSYVEDADRELARRAGADQFVIRTPEMREVLEALKESLAPSRIRERVAALPAGKLEQAWVGRVMSQLERQVSVNAGMARRCSMLSAELSILSSISDALSQHHDIDQALTEVLSACVDAGGFSLGALCLSGRDPDQFLMFGDWQGQSDATIRGLFARAELSPDALRAKSLCMSVDSPQQGLSPALALTGIVSAFGVAVIRGGVAVGALLMGSKATTLHQGDRLAFVEGVATQIGQALRLTEAFLAKDSSEKKARERATVLRSVLETVAEGVVVTDAQGEFLLWNPAAEAILGAGTLSLPAREWPARCGLRFSDTLQPVSCEQSPLRRALQGQVVDGVEPFTLRNTTSGQDKYVAINARPLEEQGAVVGAVGVLRDVTEERANQTRLLVADRLASVGMLAAGVAHEINNPLAAVVANLELATEVLAGCLGQEGASQELSEAVHMLHEASEGASRVRKIVRDLSVFSRTEADENSAVDIHRVLESVLRMAQNELRHRARLVRNYGQVPFAHGNESRLSQVFLNLIMNAVQALPDGRADQNEITLTTERDREGRVVISIADTGAGIDPEAMKRLFVPFFTTKQVGVGTGLGLSICHRLITAAGGEIRVESQPGAGSVFHVVLRAASEAENLRSKPPATEAVTPAVRRGRVLVIDDEPAILGILARALRSQHDCVGVTTASEGLARLRAGEPFDVILCDLMMPVMSGMDFHVELTRVAPEQAGKVVFLTGGAFTAKMQAFLKEVAIDHIEKPFDARTIKAAVNARVG